MKKSLIIVAIIVSFVFGNLNVSADTSAKSNWNSWCSSATDSTKKSKCIDCIKKCQDINTTAGNECAKGCETNAGISHAVYSTDLYQGKYVQCGDSGAFPAALPQLSRILVLIVEIFVPIALIIFGMLDFTKAVASNDSDFLEKAKKKFMRRLISAGAVFFVFMIVKFALSSLAGDESSGAIQCANCFISDASSCKPATYTSTHSE